MESTNEIDQSSDLIEDMSRLFLSDRFSDIMFCVDGKRMAAHKVVLATRSVIFRDLLFDATPLTHCKREIQVKDCSALSFKNFLKYIYTGKISLTGADDTDIQELLALALKYEIKPLVESLLEANSCGEETQQKSSNNSNKRSERQSSEKKDKKCLSPLKFEDMANVANGAVVVEGVNPERLFSGKRDFTDERSLTKHKIEVDSKGIIIRLSLPVLINLVKFRLLDADPKRCYSYYVQVSADNSIWQTVVDYRNYSCRSWQSLFFEQRLVQLIRIVGTNSNEKLFFSNCRYLTIVSFLCGLTQRPPKMFSGFWEPEHNMATIGKGAVVIINNGNDYCRTAKMINEYIDFESKKYNQIYSEFHFDRDSELIVHLSQPIITSSISFYIYGEEKFKYAVRVSADAIDRENKRWTIVADKRNQWNEPKWQRIPFPKTKVLLISVANIRCLDESVHTFPILSFSCP